MADAPPVAWAARGPFEQAGLRWLVRDGAPTDYYRVVEVPGPAAPREWVLYRSRPDADDPQGDARVIGFPSLAELEAWIAAGDLP
jgi:hypothetical protein